jgi:hypothetical protein
MAIVAPLHVERIDLVHQRHLIHPPVASGASDSFVNMDTVIEINKVRKVVNSDPFKRFAGPIALANRLQHFGVGPEL